MVRGKGLTETQQMIPSDIKFDGNATPPQFTDNADQVIERGTHIRVKIKGIRGEVGQMYAIATIKEDFLGYVDLAIFVCCYSSLIFMIVPSSRLESCCYDKVHQPATKIHEPTKTKQSASQEKRKEHTRLRLITCQKSAQKRCAQTVFCEAILPSFGEQDRQGKKAQIDGRKERKEAKNAFDIIL
jgi:hypothetical protein